MREAGSANAIGGEINAKGNRQCNEYPWKQLAISATDIINLCKQGEGGKDPATHSLQKKMSGRAVRMLSAMQSAEQTKKHQLCHPCNWNWLCWQCKWDPICNLCDCILKCKRNHQILEKLCNSHLFDQCTSDYQCSQCECRVFHAVDMHAITWQIMHLQCHE